ncbi:hypothetical protein [Erysipelatoclostridium sp. An15]|uniref:hypothetical protein n=1 Tax=Erysipelatoclostridium sp. An15 TaxID=1965566 RepID=UPI0013024D53|nr:hypothetical protein [Erysipelatoclostridium sp. An15]
MSDFYIMLVQFILFITALFVVSIVIFGVYSLAKNFIFSRRKRIKQIDYQEEN